MKACALVCTTTMLLILSLATGSAQTLISSSTSYRSLSASVPSREQITTIHKDVSEVRVEFTVSGPNGRPVENISPSDVLLLEDSRPVSRISDFRSESDLPLRLSLLLDTSSSIYDIFGREKQAAVEFLNQVVRPGSDQVMIETFSTKVDIVQPFSSDPGLLDRAFEKINGSEGLTSFYDAVYKAGETMLDEHDDQLARRAIILISDGEDNYSLHDLRDDIETAQRANLVVYAISIHAPLVHKKHKHYSGDPLHRGDPIMQQLAEATGGRQYVVTKDSQMPDIFQEIERELRNMYSVSFPSYSADGRFHSLQIVIANHADQVHCRSGYWAEAR